VSGPAELARNRRRDRQATSTRSTIYGSGTISMPMISVYDGRELRGFVLARGKLGFEAFDCGERSLGTFKTQREAADAITETAP
jgi:hypothetical protein